MLLAQPRHHGKQQESAMKQHSVPFLALALCAGMALAQQAPVRSSTSPRAAGVGFTSGGARAPTPTTTTVNPVNVAPGTGTAALPIGAPSPSGLASPSPFPAGIPSTTIAAPGTSAAVTSPTTVSPSVAGTGTAGGVPSSTRGVVNPGVNVPLATGVIRPAGNAATVMDPNGAASAGNAGAAISVGTPGAPGSAVIGTTQGVTATGATVIGGGLTGGVPSVSAMGSGPGLQLTALQMAQFFLQADTDRDGLLSRAEALRLPLATMTFEDMDTNRDGWVSRSEYEDSLR
jgi:hypothetical protein